MLASGNAGSLHRHVLATGEELGRGLPSRYRPPPSAPGPWVCRVPVVFTGQGCEVACEGGTCSPSTQGRGASCRADGQRGIHGTAMAFGTGAREALGRPCSACCDLRPLTTGSTVPEGTGQTTQDKLKPRGSRQLHGNQAARCEGLLRRKAGPRGRRGAGAPGVGGEGPGPQCTSAQHGPFGHTRKPRSRRVALSLEVACRPVLGLG